MDSGTFVESAAVQLSQFQSPSNAFRIGVPHKKCHVHADNFFSTEEKGAPWESKLGQSVKISINSIPPPQLELQERKANAVGIQLIEPVTLIVKTWLADDNFHRTCRTYLNEYFSNAVRSVIQICIQSLRRYPV